MERTPGADLPPGDARAAGPIETAVVPRARDLGGLEVRRALPAAERQMVGPFIFLDQMGPTRFAAGRGLDVRPHPHINLATLTYLFEGEILHRDSLGTALAIRPGAVNLMTAGRGIVHSERSPAEARPDGPGLFGLQTWLALPVAHEESEPAFAHTGADELPSLEERGARVRLVVGRAWGESSPVATLCDTLFADVALEAGAQLPVEADHEERALYLLGGALEIGGEGFAPGQLLVLRPGAPVTVRNPGPAAARFVLVGGETMDGPRHIWWNFVSSRKERIEQAKADWKAGRFDSVPGDAEEFIPLPEDAPAQADETVRYP